MVCKNCDRNFRTIEIPPNKERICYKCGFNNGRENEAPVLEKCSHCDGDGLEMCRIDGCDRDPKNKCEKCGGKGYCEV